MSLAGNWTLYYSWGCSGSYNSTSLTFNTNGTFKTGDGYSGQWASVGGNVQFVFEPTPSAVYSGTVTGGAMSGMMTNFHLGESGCWHASALKMPEIHATAKKVENAEQRDSLGNKKK